MKNLLTLFAITLMVVSFTNCSRIEKAPADESATVATESQTLVIYGSNQCHHCTDFKAAMDNAGIEYTFNDVDESDQYYREMMHYVSTSGHVGGFSIPVVVIGGSDIRIAPNPATIVEHFNK